MSEWTTQLVSAPLIEASEACRTGLTLHNGRPALIHPLKPDDEPLVGDMLQRLSPLAIHCRFCELFRQMPSQELHRFVEVNPADTLALAVSTPPEDTPSAARRIIALAHLCMEWESRDGEVAFLIEDPYQHHGLGHVLFDRLLTAARAADARTISCCTALANTTMRRLFHDCATGRVTSFFDPPELWMSFTLR